MVERIDVSVHYKLAKTRSDSDIVTISLSIISTQQSVDVLKLDIATTAECCRSIVRALFCCSRCTPENILAAKISWTIGVGAQGGPPLNTSMMRPEPDWISFCHSLQCLQKNQKARALLRTTLQFGAVQRFLRFSSWF